MKRLLSSIIAVGIVLFATSAMATSIDVGFTRVSPANADVNVQDQFNVSILDSASALAEYAVNIEAGQVLFTFTNTAVVASSISEIYLDEGNTHFLFDRIINSLGGSTDFTGAPVSPPNLPGGQNLVPMFEATTVLSADAVGNPNKGVNTAQDVLGLVYTVDPVTDILSGIAAALSVGDLRIGLHVRAIGDNDEDWSDSFVSTPVPEPATMLLFGTGLAGLAGLSRRKKSQK